MNITFREVCFAYERFGESAGDDKKFQLRNLSFEISSPQFVAIAGRSGSGKTTLLQMFNGLLRPARGEVLIDQQNIHARGYDLAALRRRLGLVFQFPEAQLFAATVREDVGFAPRQQKLSSAETEARTLQALQEVGLSENFLARDPFTLSAGEKRRAALAGILAMQPEMLILDEPTAGLDAKGIVEIKTLLWRWHEQGRGLIMISHDLDLIAELAQRVFVLHQGEIIFNGSPHQLWDDRSENSAPAPFEICARAGLAVPRAERLKRLLRAKNIDFMLPSPRSKILP